MAMKFSRLAIIFTLACSIDGCSNGSNATRVLSEQGYTNIQTTGWAPFACSKDDDFETGFKAVSPSGTPVRGAVCSGWFFKNSTIRFQ